MIRRLCHWILAASLSVVCLIGQAEPAWAREALASVVEIRVLSRPPDLLYPWRRKPVSESWGSGAVLSQQRIITAAHVIEDHVEIEVRRRGTSRWYPARAEHVGHQADLALLSVTDPNFWREAPALRLGRMPEVGDAVQVLGFPSGGTSAAVTRGIVSRVQVARYSYSRANLLLVQIDAPINPGASGGPVIADKKLVGIALQAVDPGEGESIGHMAPLPVVQHFLRDVEDGRVDGFPRSGIWWQALQAEAHRSALGIPDDGIGVLVSHVDEGSPAFGKVEAGDVLRAIGGYKVADDGSVDAPIVGRANLEYAVQMMDAGSPIEVEILRRGAKRRLKLRAARYDPMIAERNFEGSAQYLIFGGLVFQPLTYRYFSVFQRNDPPANLGAESLSPYRTRTRRQVIVISGILPSASTSSYRWAEDRIVRTIDGTPVRDLVHLAELIDGAQGSFLRITVDGEAELVFDLASARRELANVLHEHDASLDRNLGEADEGFSVPASPDFD